jgi:hypothetical protein
MRRLFISSLPYEASLNGFSGLFERRVFSSDFACNIPLRVEHSPDTR